MNEIREIVTKAVIAKGKKTIRIKANVLPNNDTFSILGCWVINHGFTATLDQDCVKVDGNFEINIWYAYDENSKTELCGQNCAQKRLETFMLSPLFPSPPSLFFPSCLSYFLYNFLFFLHRITSPTWFALTLL